MKRMKFIVLVLTFFICFVPQTLNGDIRADLRNCILKEFEEGEINLIIEGSEEDLAQGRFKKIQIEANQFSTIAKLGEFFPEDTQLEKEILNFSLPGLVVDKGVGRLVQGKFEIATFRKEGKLKILELEKSYFYAMVSEENLEKFIQNQNPQFKNLQIRLFKDLVKVSFEYPLLFLKIPVKMVGRLVLENPSQIYVKDFTLYVSETRMIWLGNLLIARINPVVDFTKLPFSAKIEEIEITPGWLRISFSVKI